MTNTNPTAPAALTTFAKWNGTQRGNYCTLPSIDVPIIETQHACSTCNKPVEYRKGGGMYGMDGFAHVDGTTEHTVYVHPTCRYCGCNEPGAVIQHQRPWSNETECTRCGGISGYPIGD